MDAFGPTGLEFISWKGLGYELRTLTDTKNIPDNVPVVVVGQNGGETIKIKDNYAEVYAGEGHDTIIAGSGKNFIYGFGGNDNISSGAGNDIIGGGDGNDKIYGGAGNDVLIGDSGNDTLEGGFGNDGYHYTGDPGFDIITDTGDGILLFSRLDMIKKHHGKPLTVAVMI